MADELPPLTGDPSKDLPPLTGDLSKDVGVQGPLGAQPDQRTGLSRILLGQPGGAVRGGATVPAMIARALGASDPTAEGVGRFGQGVQRSLAMPWAPGMGAVPMAVRAAQSAGLGAAEGVSRGESAKDIGTRAIVGGILSPIGDYGAQLARGAFSAIPHKLFSDKSGGQLAEWLRQNVPAWAGMKGNRALYEMAREGGQAKLSDAYAKALMDATKAIPAGTTVNLSAEAAKRAGFGLKDVPVDRMGMVAVDAQRLMQSIPNLVKDQTTRRAVLDALTEGLPSGVIPQAAMNAYRTGSGWMDFAKKSGLFKKGEDYSAHLAQQGLRSVGKETLERRGMEGARNIIRGPLSKPPIEKGTMRTAGTVLGALAGSAGGGTLGSLLGAPGVGGAGGATAGALGGGFLGGRLPVYKNVPQTLPQLGQLRQALLQALAQAATGAVKSTGQ